MLNSRMVRVAGRKRKRILDGLRGTRGQIMQALGATGRVWIFDDSFIEIQFTCRTTHPFQGGVWILC